MIISDPTQYPVVFKLSERADSPLVDDVADALITVDGDIPLTSAVCRYSDRYLLDYDPFSSSTPSASSGRKVIFEFHSTSSNPASAQVLSKVWLSSTSSYSYYDGRINLRQSVSSDSTEHTAYVSNSFNSMSAVNVSDVDYWPSLLVSYSGTPLMDGSTVSFSGTASPSSSSDYVVCAASDTGLVMILFSWEYQWYLDEARTILAGSTPASLPDIDGHILCCLSIPSAGNSMKSGEILTSGLASFSNVPKGDSAPQVEIMYASGSDTLSILNSTIKIGEDGMPDQSGNTSAIYVLSAT